MNLAEISKKYKSLTGAEGKGCCRAQITKPTTQTNQVTCNEQIQTIITKDLNLQPQIPNKLTWKGLFDTEHYQN